MKKPLKTFVFLPLLASISSVFAQNGLLSPNGVSFPTYTNALRPAANSVGAGTVLFNSTNNVHQYSNGSTWLNLQGAGVLPSGIDNQTLRYFNGNWIATDNLINDGTTVSLKCEFPLASRAFRIETNNSTIGLEVKSKNSSGIFSTSDDYFGVRSISNNYIGLFASGQTYSAQLIGRIQLFKNYSNTLDAGIEFFNNTGRSGYIGKNGENELMVFGYGLNAPIQRWNVNTGAICYATTPTVCSDIRLKKDFVPISNALTKLSMLQGYHYHWKNEKMVGLQTGFIAQEVQKIFPELVKTDTEGYLSVDYVGLVPHLVEANKRLKKQNEEMLERIEALEKRFSSQFEASNSTKNIGK